MTKSFQNLSKILAKPSQNSSRTLPEPSFKTATQKNRIFAIFFSFWRAQPLPKSTQNHQKSQKSAEKSKSKKHMFLNTIFSRIFLVFASENEAKIDVFRYFFENVDLVKIVLPSRRNCYFSGSEPQKNDQKSMPKRARKKHRKNTSQKSILASILGSKTLPKSIEIPPKSDVKRSLFRDAMEITRKSPKTTGSHGL